MKILGIKYEVKHIESNAGWDEFMGRANSKMGVLAVCSDMPEEIQKATMLHEIIEVIDALNELKLKHNQTTTLANNLYCILKENGVDTKFLTGE